MCDNKTVQALVKLVQILVRTVKHFIAKEPIRYRSLMPGMHKRRANGCSGQISLLFHGRHRNCFLVLFGAQLDRLQLTSA